MNGPTYTIAKSMMNKYTHECCACHTATAGTIKSITDPGKNLCDAVEVDEAADGMKEAAVDVP